MKIQVTNHSSVVGPAEFLTMVTAGADQLRNEFAAAHSKVPSEVEPNLRGVEDPDAFQMGIFDDADQPGALGYHDVDSQGKPRGFVFAKTTISDGQKVSVTFTHEMMEMDLDPYCNRWVQTADGNMRALEASDAVESDSYSKTVGDETVEVSNFVTEYYFAQNPTGRPTDHMNKLSGAVAPARSPGGYDIVVDTSGNPSQEFSKHLAAMSPLKRSMKMHPLSRTARRAAALKRSA